MLIVFRLMRSNPSISATSIAHRTGYGIEEAMKLARQINKIIEKKEAKLYKEPEELASLSF